MKAVRGTQQHDIVMEFKEAAHLLERKRGYDLFDAIRQQRQIFDCQGDVRLHYLSTKILEIDIRAVVLSAADLLVDRL